MVYDHLNNGVPVAFFVPSSATGANVAAFLAAFRDKCRERKADFAFNCLLTDNDAAQLQALRRVKFSPGSLDPAHENFRAYYGP